MTNKAYYHLPGLFEFYDLYAAFLPIFRMSFQVFYFAMWYNYCSTTQIKRA